MLKIEQQWIAADKLLK